LFTFYFIYYIIYLTTKQKKGDNMNYLIVQYKSKLEIYDVIRINNENNLQFFINESKKLMKDGIIIKFEVRIDK
jgi:O-glycosyl hydrolase